MKRRSLLSGLATGLAMVAQVIPPPRARSALAAAPPSTSADVTNFSVPFGPTGSMGATREDQARLVQLLRARVAAPLSDVIIYAHGWLTDANDLMVIYDTVTLGYGRELRDLRRAGALSLSLPTSTLVIMTHWPSRHTENARGPITGLLDLLPDLSSFAKMEARSNLVGSTGMARLIGNMCEHLLADPDLASTQIHLIGHSFGCRVVASALQTFARTAPRTFGAIQNRNLINLVLLQAAFPSDALEPNSPAQAHPYAQLANYRDLRVLVTMSEWDLALRRYYPAQEAVQPADAMYARTIGTRAEIPALGGVGPTDATWKAFNGDLPRTAISVGPGFRYRDAIMRPDQRLVVADLAALHAAHYQQDMARPDDQLPPVGRPTREAAGVTGYHSDIFNNEVYQLDIGFAYGTAGARAGGSTT